jgi:hypothetical protein
MGQIDRYQEILRKLAIIDDGFVEDRAGLGLSLAGARVLDPGVADAFGYDIEAALEELDDDRRRL